MICLYDAQNKFSWLTMKLETEREFSISVKQVITEYMFASKVITLLSNT